VSQDWIKARGTLVNSPKVVRMSKFLHCKDRFRDWLMPGWRSLATHQIVSDQALQCVTNSLLIVTWSQLRHHGKFVGADLFVENFEVFDIDGIANVPEFGAAMEHVRWAIQAEDPVGVAFPNFLKYNVPITNAEKQKAYRDRKKSADPVDDTEKCYGLLPSVTPPEKRREEKSNTKNKSKNPNFRITKSQAESIYLSYPRKIGKNTAIPATKRAAKRLAKEGNKDPITWLQERVVAYAASPAGQSPPDGSADYRPYPATWMNQGRYDDDESTWTQPNGDNGNGKTGATGKRADKYAREYDGSNQKLPRIVRA